MYGGTCAIKDPGCYLCISSSNPAQGCAVCAEGFKKVSPSLKTNWSMGRRALLQATAAPYCLGSSIKARLENDVLVRVGELNAAINATTTAQKNALFSLGNGANAALAGATAPIQDLVRNPLQKAEEQRSAISSLVTDFAAEERA